MNEFKDAFATEQALCVCARVCVRARACLCMSRYYDRWV